MTYSKVPQRNIKTTISYLWSPPTPWCKQTAHNFDVGQNMFSRTSMTSVQTSRFGMVKKIIPDLNENKCTMDLTGGI